MYLEFYGLSGEPFRLTPDARFFYESRTHRKAIAYLTYGLGKAEGFVVMTGEIGAGKTTLLEHLRATLTDPAIATGWIVTSQVEADDLLRLVASSFHLPGTENDKGSLIRRIEAFLIRCREQGRRACLIVDEAQSLSLSSLEELRMLSNLHGTGAALLQIVLVGQPDFRGTLQSPNLEQLRQRVIVSCHLPMLDEDETAEYVRHRLRCVNWRDDPQLSDAALARVHAVTGGLPRRINLLCDRLLLYGFMEGKHSLDGSDVDFVIADYQDEITGVVSASGLTEATADRKATTLHHPPALPTPEPSPLTPPAQPASAASRTATVRPATSPMQPPSAAPAAAAAGAAVDPGTSAPAALALAVQEAPFAAGQNADPAFEREIGALADEAPAAPLAGSRLLRADRALSLGLPIRTRAWLLLLALGGFAALIVLVIVIYLISSGPPPAAAGSVAERPPILGATSPATPDATPDVAGDPC